MISLDKNTQAFFALMRAGLWTDAETNFDLNDNANFDGKVDWEKVYQLAGEQSVVGLVLAGIERYNKLNDNARSPSPLGLSKNLNFDDNANHTNQLIDNEGDSQLGLRSTLRLELPPQELLLQWIGEVQILEQQNKAMNEFVAKLIEKLSKEDVYAILVKGQGIAQCYEKPLWRASGDVDLLLDAKNYEKAKAYLTTKADSVDPEYTSESHLSMMIKDYVVELHGSMHTRLSKSIDSFVDNVQDGTFKKQKVRSWRNGAIEVSLPAPDEDIIFVFTHIIKHFFLEGIGLRQICDWCRLLWTYKDTLNHGLLEKRIRKMGLMSEWKAFAALAVDSLGMPKEAMPFYDSRFKVKGERILEFVLEMGNFGHNREIETSKSYIGGKLASTFRKLKDFGHHMRIFPIDSVKFFCYFAIDGIGGAMRGE